MMNLIFMIIGVIVCVITAAALIAYVIWVLITISNTVKRLDSLRNEYIDLRGRIGELEYINYQKDNRTRN